jgi:hypothetical protein
MSQAEKAQRVREMAVELARVYKGASAERQKHLRRLFFLAFAKEFGKNAPSRKVAGDLMKLANEVIGMANALYRQVDEAQ